MVTAAQDFDVAIVGGGMVGASLACLLAQSCSDQRIALIEAFAMPNGKPDAPLRPSFDARSTALAQGSVEIFQQLGLWSTLAQHATPLHQVHVSDRGHFGGSVIDAAEQGLDALGYVVENRWLGAVLLQQMQAYDNITCIAPARVTSLQPRRDGALLQVSAADASPAPLCCKLAVIADGGDSPLRKALGIQTQNTDYGQQAIVANVAFDQSHQQVAYERFTDQGPLALLPLGEGTDNHRSALVWTQPQDRAEAIMGLSDPAFLAELQQRFGYRLGHFTKVGERSAYPLHLVAACEQVRSHIVLMGNAAHSLHPVAGQGFNLALRDCATLVEVLREGERCGAALGKLSQLQEYQRRQHLDQTSTIRFSDTMAQLFSTAQLPAAVLRHLGFLGLELLPAAKDLLARQSMGKAIRSPRL